MIARVVIASLLSVLLVNVALCDYGEDTLSVANVAITSFEVGGKVDGLAWLTAEPASLAVLVQNNKNLIHFRAVLLYDAQSGRKSRTVFATTNPLLAIAIAPKDAAICCAMWRETNDPFSSKAEIWKLRQHEKLASLAGSPTTNQPRMQSDLLTVSYSPDGALIAGGAKLVSDGDIAGQHLGGEVWVWDVQGRKLLWSDRTTHTDIVYATAFSPDGRFLASGGYDKLIRIWDPSTGRLAKTLHGAAWSGLASLTFVDDGRLLASGGLGTEEGHLVRVWDVATGQHLHTLRGFMRGGTVRVAAAATSKRLFGVGLRETSSSEQPEWHVQCWDAVTGKLLYALPPQPGFPQAIAVSNAENVAVGTVEGRVVVFAKQPVDNPHRELE